MTIKKKPTGELEEVKQSLTTNSFRWALLFLVLSMHPVGRSFLGTMGFVLPDQASEKRTQEEVQHLKEDLAAVKQDIAKVKEDVGDVKTSVDTLRVAITGFQVDFDKYKKHP